MKRFLIVICTAISMNTLAQSEGEVMFVGYNADGSDGFAFVTFVPLPNGTTIYFNDNEWNGLAIGSGGAFNDTSEGAITWTNNTGNTISAGTIITIQSATNSPTVNLGSVTESEDGFDLEVSDEVLYMFLGTDDATPTSFLSTIANDGFGSPTPGPLTGTGLTSGTDATSISGDEDIMVYTGSLLCTTSISACATAVATTGNWTTDDGVGDQSSDGMNADFPADVPVNFYGTVFEGVAYYSRNATSGGNWDDPNAWTTVSDGSGGPLSAGIYPASPDNVVILSGHTITIDAVTDNQASGISPDGLGRANVGAFPGSGDAMFYHTGDVIIANGGTLSATEEVMLEGYSLVADGGTFNIAEDIVNLGYLEVSTTGTLSANGGPGTEDLILSGNSITIIDNTSTSDDDLYIDWTDATLCGDGIMSLGNGGPDPTVQFFNGATGAQICSSFTITCTSNCGGFSDGSPSGSFITGNTGPGGVGDDTNIELWLRADDLSLANGANVTSWADASGNGLTAVSSGMAAEEPIFVTNSVNTSLPSISFDGVDDFLNLGTPASLNPIPGTDSWTFFIVYNVANPLEQGTFFAKGTSTGSTRQYQYTIDDASGTSRFTSFIGGSIQIGSITSTGGWFVSSHTNNTTNRDSWTNEGDNFANQTIGSGQVQTAEVLIGARRGAGPTTGTGFLLEGSIAEIAMYDLEVTAAQRIIVTNYLAAKYDITLSANDEYDMDDNANGDFDFEVAGFGQASDGSNHLDAQGSSIVRMWNPSALGNSEFLLWGHDNATLTATTTAVGTDVDGTVIEERLTRIWRLAETGDVGIVSVSFDISSFNNPLGSNLRLLIDRDGDGFADNDVTPISGSSVGDIVVFSGVDFQDGDRFTLGNADFSLPLPVELLSFQVKVTESGGVRVLWTTASEHNNSHFTVLRSKDAIKWEVVSIVSGAGNSLDIRKYEFTDQWPHIGLSYYRLKQTDFDGTSDFSEVKNVIVNEPLIEITNAYPNPTDGTLYLRSNLDLSSSQISLFNAVGSKIPISFDFEQGELMIYLEGVPTGLYFLRITRGSYQLNIRIIKQ